ncbi:SMI1/KNR4 family protein [Streptomyces albidoflavus]
MSDDEAGQAGAEAVRAAWGRIDAWLRKRGPDSYARLAPPAEPGAVAVAAAEAALHMRFPAELRASLGCHDGAGGEGVLPVKPPLSAAGIVRYWTRWMELTEEEREFGDPEEEGEPSWHPRWIPWAESDGDAQIIDGRDGPGFGRLGMKYHDEEGSFGDDAPSLAAYLTEVADALENGRSVGGRVPYVGVSGEMWWAAAPAAPSGGG